MPHSHINRVVLTGNLTRDPELREVKGRDLKVCHLRLACNGRRKDGAGGWTEVPNFFDVSVFGTQGENVERYLKKGRPVAIDGRLVWREWKGADDQRRQGVTIVADSVQFLGSREGPRASDGTSTDPTPDVPSDLPPDLPPAEPFDGPSDAPIAEFAMAAVGAGAEEEDDLPF